MQILLIISGIEVDPGHVLSKKTKLSFAVWNLDRIPAREFERILLNETFQATYDFDLFGVCESLSNKDIVKGDILINGFSPDPLRVDKPENIRNDLEILPEPIVAENKLNRKNIFIVILLSS